MIHGATVVNAARNDRTDWKYRNFTLFFSAINSWRAQTRQTSTSVIIQIWGKLSNGRMYLLNCTSFN